MGKLHLQHMDVLLVLIVEHYSQVNKQKHNWCCRQIRNVICWSEIFHLVNAARHVRLSGSIGSCMALKGKVPPNIRNMDFTPQACNTVNAS